MGAMRLLKLSVFVLLAACSGTGEHPDQAGTKAVLQPRLPTGNYLDPAGTAVPLGSFPMNATLSPEGTRVVVLLNGWREQGIQVVDRATGNITQTITLPSVFAGMSFAPDGKSFYVSGGNSDLVYRFDWNNGMAALRDSFVLAVKPDPRRSGKRYAAGVAASRDGQRLYVAENLGDSLAIIDLASREIKRVAAGRYPYGVAEDADGNVLVTAWAESNLYVINPRTLEKSTVEVGRHPSTIITNRAGTIAFITSASTDRVIAYDTRARKVSGLLQSSAPGTREGATPNGLALSADERRLYVAEADNNALAVWDLGRAELLGRVPVEWYPTQILVAGDSVLVINGKGKGTAPNPGLPHPGTGTQERDPSTRLAYTLGQLNGSLTTLTRNELGDVALQNMTKRVAAANGWNAPRTTYAYPPFEHVIYVIKENRTYDQVLGDLTQADGDTSLLFFGRDISPNHHALAERFGIYDRFFVNAEVSATGHNWSTGAYVTDYLEKTVPSNYSSRGRSYDYEGSNRGVPVDGDDDVASPATGYIWDLVERAKLTLRNYGEYVEPVRVADRTVYRGTKRFLAANTNEDFAGFDMQIPDQDRIAVWLTEFNQYVRNGNLPHFQIVRLPSDHTSGARAGAHTPRAHMADNDLALGKLVEAVSRSPYWKNTAIFVLEDDAQNGPDHVDSHRSPFFVISAYSRSGRIDRFTNTTDAIATMAEILKMGTLSQFDYYGRPLRDVWTSKPDLRPYTALAPKVDLNERNPSAGRGAIESEKLNLAKEDESEDDFFNVILWRAIKGDKVAYPGATRMPAVAPR